MNYPSARDERAAYWHLRLHDADVSAQEIQEFLRWQRESAENQAAFDRIEAFSYAWRAIDRREATRLVRPGYNRSIVKSWFALAATLAAVAVLASLQFLPRKFTTLPIEYATAVGENRTVLLEDGSTVVLGGATAIRTEFSDKTRRVFLTGGEALFLVAKSAARPFIVEAADGSARAVGTEFNVHQGPEGTTVTVVKGVVEVRPIKLASGSARLQAGDQVRVSGAKLTPVTHVNAAAIVDWSKGRKVFIDQPLMSVISDLNRYSHKTISLAAPDAARVHITGTLKTDAIEPWLQSLSPIAHVRMVEDATGIVLMPAD